MTIGANYRFIVRATNAIGDSEFSDYGYISFGDVPAAPGAPQRLLSTET